MKHRIFRAHCTNPAPKLAENEEAEYTVFVEADTPEQASMRIQVSLSTLSGLSIEDGRFLQPTLLERVSILWSQ